MAAAADLFLLAFGATVALAGGWRVAECVRCRREDAALVAPLSELLCNPRYRLSPGRPGNEARRASRFNALADAAARHELTSGAGLAQWASRGDPDGLPFVAVVAPFRSPGVEPAEIERMRLLAAVLVRAIPGARLGRVTREGVELGFAAADGTAAAALLETLPAALIAADAGEAGIGAAAVVEGDAVGGLAAARSALARARTRRLPLVIHDPDRDGDSADRALIDDLREALKTGAGLCLHHQPKLNVRTDEIAAVEALVRWEHPRFGTVGPDRFVPLAERFDAIRALTEWVLLRALQDRATLAARGHELVVHINISASLLADREFARWALDRIADTSQVGFEITETAMIEDPEGTLANLEAFAAAGIRIAIDDYGAGLSSLAYLKRLPAQELKIDKMFVSGLTSSHKDPLLVRSTIDLAHALEMEVTAEGVDSPAALALLRVMGCDVVQGYLIAAPMPVDTLATFLQAPRAVAAVAAVPFAGWIAAARAQEC